MKKQPESSNEKIKRAMSAHISTYRADSLHPTARHKKGDSVWGPDVKNASYMPLVPRAAKPPIDKRAPKPPTESQEQINLVQWLAITFPLVKFLAVPNGGNRNVITATRLKREGVSAGVPDLFFPEWHLWIEMKRTVGGVTSDEQKAWQTHLANIGYTVLVCTGAEVAKRAIRQHIVMLDERDRGAGR
jgi:hypothetical protein